jgi:hypothetical protein
MPSPDPTSCPVCRSRRVFEVIRIDRVPVCCNVLWKTREEALRAPKGDIHLHFCQECGHLFNSAFDPALMEYDSGYENSLHFSPRFQHYAEALAADLVERHSLKGKNIVEIACGKGDFLHLLCRLGDNRGFGFDPSYECDRHEPAEDVTIFRDYFGKNAFPWTADLVCCRQALEHIRFPTDFLAEIRKAIGEKTGTAVFFEVPNSLYTLRDLGIWDIIYEHCSFFWAGSLRQSFELAGFKVTQVGEAFDEQFLCIEGFPSKDQTPFPVRSPDLDEVRKWAAIFEGAHRKKVSHWKERLNDMAKAGKRAVVWGGGSKGIAFLNLFENQGTIEYVVDVNPQKQGKFVPGTGHEIVSPKMLIKDEPEVVVLMNPIYGEEVFAMLRQFGVSAQIIVA